MFTQNRFIIALMLLHSMAMAQPALKWDVTFGGHQYEELNGLAVVSDGVLIGGSSRSNTEFGLASDTSWNILLAKLDFNGNLIWYKMYGGDRHDRLWNLMVTRNGDILMGGYSWSGPSGIKSSANFGSSDAWLLRCDATGNLLWEKSYGGSGRDEMFSMLEMPDGDLMLGCHSWSNAGGNKSENCRGHLDFWLVRTDASGNIEWDKTIGGDNEDQLHDILIAPDGMLLASGGTVSKRNTGEVGPDYARGAKDYWIIKVNPDNGQLIWNHRHGGTDDDFAYSLHVSADGKTYLGGRSASFSAPPTTYNNGKDAAFYGGDSDYWLLELDNDGKKVKEWSFGGNGLDDLYSMNESIDGKLVIGGVTDSGISGNKTAPARGKYDYWIIQLDPVSGIDWQLTLGGTDIDAMTRIVRDPDGALYFGGHSQSNASFEKTQNSAGVNDFWLISTLCNPTVDIKRQIEICSNEPESVTVATTNCIDCNFLWSTGSTNDQIEIEPGFSDTIWVRINDENGCIAFDTLWIEKPLTPVLQLGPADTLILASSTVYLGQSDPTWTYQWSTGASTSTLAVNTEGIYSLTVTDNNGCSATDAIRIRIKEEAFVWAPNAFSPDLDGVNDFFTIYASQNIQQIAILQINDRWGEPVFRKSNFQPNIETEGWNGKYREKAVENGVYVWFARVVFEDGSVRLFEGSITVARK